MKRYLLTCVAVGVLAGVGAVVSAAEAGKAAEPAEIGVPALPAIAKLVLEPGALTLEDGRDGRMVLVWGVTADGRRFDLTSQATLKPDSPMTRVDGDGFVYPVAEGTGTVSVSAAGQSAKLAVTVTSAAVPAIGFVRDVEPVIAKVGCNAGTCHGANRGKNGFRLSLRGYDPAFDYQSLVNDISGRRFNRVAPQESLMLLKPTAEVPHEGLQVVEPGSRYYHTLLQWIKEGTHPQSADARAVGIEVLPTDVALDLPGRSQQVMVHAHYSDGSVRDVTREAVISVNNIEIAKAEGNRISGLRRGEAAVLVRYEGNYATALVTIMGDRTGFAWKPMAEYNFIDKHVNAKLERVKTLPSPRCDDAQFVRRVYLDLTGQPPQPQVARAFVEDAAPSETKRQRLIDELIGSNDYVEFWANKWADLLQCNQKALGDKGVWTFRSWIRRAIASNMPYDQFVRTLLTAEGSSYKNPPVNYMRVLREPNKATEDVTQTFLGTRFNCNKCHDHPFERWTLDQYYEFGAFFARVAFKKGAADGEEVVYVNYNGGEVTHPKKMMVVPPQVPYGKAPDAAKGEDRRQVLIDWLTAKDNPLFARSFVNRIWSYFFGIGIIDPVDDIRAGNPPSNPALLDALADDFIAHGFDAQRLMRMICNSRTYQASITSDKWNEDDRINFSHAMPRRLSAEQLLDAIAIATDTHPNISGLPAGMRAVYAPSGEIKGNDFLELFGRPKRESACECERAENLSLSHALSLINGNTINDAVTAPNNRVARLVRDQKDNAKVVEAIYYAALCRPPNDAEIAAIDLGEGDAHRLEVAQDLMWALLNSPAFVFNR